MPFLLARKKATMGRVRFKYNHVWKVDCRGKNRCIYCHALADWPLAKMPCPSDGSYRQKINKTEAVRNKQTLKTISRSKSGETK